MAQNQGTVVADAIVPAGQNATHFDVFGQGGFRVVRTLDERDSIPVGESIESDGISSGKRKPMMVVGVLETQKYYQLNIAEFLVMNAEAKLEALGDNTKWEEFQIEGKLLVSIDYYTAYDRVTGGEIPDYTFIEGGYYSVSNSQLYQCLKTHTLSYNPTTEEWTNYFEPGDTPEYFLKVLQDPSVTCISKTDFNYKITKTGSGASSVVISHPYITQNPTGNYGFILGGFSNQTTGLVSSALVSTQATVAAENGVVIGGIGNTLPDGATRSIMMSGRDYTAPAIPDTVFAPRFYSLKPGDGYTMVATNGTTIGQLSVSSDGRPLWNGLPIGGLVTAPASSTSTGITGEQAYSAGYMYRCVATDTWVRYAVEATF